MKTIKNILSGIIAIFVLSLITLTNVNTVKDSTTYYTVKDKNNVTSNVSDKDLYLTYDESIGLIMGLPNNYFNGDTLTLTFLTETTVVLNDIYNNQLYETTVPKDSSVGILLLADYMEFINGPIPNVVVATNQQEVYAVRFMAKEIEQDNKRPAIDGEEVFVTNVNNPYTIEYIQSQFSAWDETDGDVTDRIFIDSDEYSANRHKVGTYEIVIGVDDLSGNEAYVTVYVTVVDIDAPVITGNSSTVNQSYTKLWDIEAFRKTLDVTDNYDDLSNSDITVKTDNYTANFDKVGTYSIIFEAVDSSGNKSTFEKKVKVIDDVNPTISGPKTLETTNTTTLTEAQIRAQLTANDAVDGNLTSKIKLETDNYTSHGSKVGTYTIIYSVTDAAGNKATHTVTINRTDKKAPVLSGTTSHTSNVDNPLSLQTIQNALTANDETDGNITSSIYVDVDNFTANKRVRGTHTIVFAVKDAAGNKATITVSVIVVDTTPPVITGNSSTVSISYTKTFNVNDFKATLEVTDNLDTLTHSNITIKSNGYAGNENKLGTYTIVFEVADKSGNKGTFEKKIKVIDDIAPTFSGTTSFTTSNNTILTESDIRSQITANDDIDDNLTGKGNKVGTYTIVYSVTDAAGNKTTHTVTIKRLDKIPPVIWIQDGVTIRTNPDTPLTFEQIIQILQATGQVSVSSKTTFNIEAEDYFGNEDVVGIYAMSVSAKSTDGQESIHNLTIRVLGSEQGGTDVEPDFDLVEFVKENWLYIVLTISGITLVGYIYFKKRK